MHRGEEGNGYEIFVTKGWDYAHLCETYEKAVAIAREKQIKGWLRAKKIALIETANPEWKDLSAEWYL